MHKIEDIVNKIICGDCLEVMKDIPDNSVDTVLTDPPYGLGFMNKEWDKGIAFQKETWEEILRVAKPGATLLCFGGTRTYHRLACAIEDAGWIIKDCIMWIHSQGFPKATDISLQLDKKAGLQKQRGVGGFNTGGMQEQQNRKAKLYKGSVTDGSKLKGYDEPKSEEAKLWNGYKSHGLKPAVEPIVVAMKENEGSYAENALKWGVAGLNIDGGRINTREKGQSQGQSQVPNRDKTELDYYPKTLGRFPANIILECICDEVKTEPTKTKEPDEVRGGIWRKSEGKPAGRTYQGGRQIHTNPECPCYMLDRQSGNGVSRFFYCAKASRSERGDGNSHPTVKPISLLQYLCNLTKTPTGGIVLDPFAGSGTTGMACIKTKRPYILIEKELDYVPIAEARIKATPSPLF